MRREPLDQIVNRSVNETLGRTIITSGTTMLAVLALYLLEVRGQRGGIVKTLNTTSMLDKLGIPQPSFGNSTGVLADV